MMLVSFAPLPMNSLWGAFLLAFPALFSIVNPIASSLIFKGVTADLTPSERHALARKISVYSVLILLGSLWFGGYILGFFGISLGALRVAGWSRRFNQRLGAFDEPQKHEDRKAEHAAPALGMSDDVAFFPLTMPLTTGPGSIAVAIALSSQRPSVNAGMLGFFGGVSAAAVSISFLVWVSYTWSDRVVALLGATGARVVSRLVAFILLCVGIQIIITGIESLASSVMPTAPH